METITSRIYKPAEFSAGQIHEMLVTLGRKGFSPEMAAEVANTKSGKAEEIIGLFQCVPTIQELVANWQSFYQKFFGEQYDFSEVRIPPYQLDFDRVIIVAKGLTPNKVFEVMQKHFPCWRYTDDLDKATQGLNESVNPPSTTPSGFAIGWKPTRSSRTSRLTRSRSGVSLPRLCWSGNSTSSRSLTRLASTWTWTTSHSAQALAVPVAACRTWSGDYSNEGFFLYNYIG